MLNPCARESKAQTVRFLRKKLIPDYGLISSFQGQQGAVNGQDSWGIFQGYTGLWTAGYWFARRLHQPKASTTMDLGISIFLFSAWRGLKKLGLVGQNCLECDVYALLLRMLAMSRRQQSESTAVTLDME